MKKKEFGGTTPWFFHTLWITFEVQLLTMDKLGLVLFTLAFDQFDHMLNAKLSIQITYQDDIGLLLESNNL